MFNGISQEKETIYVLKYLVCIILQYTNMKNPFTMIISKLASTNNVYYRFSLDGLLSTRNVKQTNPHIHRHTKDVFLCLL